MIDVILPVYIITEELLQLTAATIESLGECHLILIDNGSTMGGGFLRSKADVYIRNKENLGYARAVNQGLKLALSSMIAIANNDIRVSPNWQEVAREAFEEPRTYSCHFRMTDYDVPFEYGKEIVYTGKERWCTSSFFVLNSQISVDSLFSYDEHYLNSYDDWDYWFRVRQAKYRTAYSDKACYQHHHSTTQKLLPQREEQNTKNREYFKHKWGEYPEDLFTRLYPEQMKIPYQEGFAIH